MDCTNQMLLNESKAYFCIKLANVEKFWKWFELPSYTANKEL